MGRTIVLLCSVAMAVVLSGCNTTQPTYTTGYTTTYTTTYVKGCNYVSRCNYGGCYNGCNRCSTCGYGYDYYGYGSNDSSWYNF